MSDLAEREELPWSALNSDSLKIISKHNFWFLEHHQRLHPLKQYIMNCVACIHMDIVY